MSGTTDTVAGRVGVLITNEGRTHDPDAWALVVTDGLVSLSPDMPRARAEPAVRTRARVQVTLVQAFHEAKATASSAQLASVARAARQRIQEIFEGTPWQVSADHPEIAALIEQHILRNLTSAADQALFAE